MTILGIALAGYALLPSAAQAQVVYVQPGRVYAAPIVVAQPVVPSYYYAPSVTTYSSSASYSYYPPSVSYSYSAPGVVTYSAPAAVVVPSGGVITTRSYYGFGVLRPRGLYTKSYDPPLP
jgi:hypothetical protein